MEQYESRIQKLRQKLQSEDLDAFLVLIQENRRYLSGFTAEDGQYDESSGALIVTGEALILATDSRFESQARQEAPGWDVLVYQKGLVKELPEIARSLKFRRLGFETRRMTHEIHSRICKELDDSGLSVELVPCLEMVETLRLVKDETEIRALDDAVALAESAFSEFLQGGKIDGAAETEAAWELEKRMREKGAEAIAFPVIAASGPNAALPHAIPQERRFGGNDPLLFDWGARLTGYCSDMSRTLFLREPEPEFQKIFTAVYDAQQKAIDAIRPGIGTCAIDAAAREHINACGYKGCFGHGLGHGVGLAVHETPSLSPVAEREKTICENMVFTVEPGIYIPGRGGVRLENMVVVRSHGAEVFNKLQIRMDMLYL